MKTFSLNDTSVNNAFDLRGNAVVEEVLKSFILSMHIKV